MKIIRRLPLVAGILALGAGLPVFAQTARIDQDTRVVDVIANIPVMMFFAPDSVTTPVNFSFAQGDYGANGTGTKTELDATTLRISANAQWELKVSADSQNFAYAPGATGGTDPSKTCADLKLSPRSTGTYTPVTVVGQTIATGGAGGSATPANIIPVSYQLDSTLAGDPPGEYTLTLTYTLVSL